MMLRRRMRRAYAQGYDWAFKRPHPSMIKRGWSQYEEWAYRAGEAAGRADREEFWRQR